MDISSLTGTNNVAGGDASAEDRASVEKEGFLKLLIAQLSNQDPMAPQDSEKYVQQFTQFSMLEQMMNLNKGVEGLSLGQISNNTQEAVRFVGRSVVAKGDALRWDEETGISPVKYRLQDDAERVELKIYNANGDIVRTVSLPNTAGPVSLIGTVQTTTDVCCNPAIIASASNRSMKRVMDSRGHICAWSSG